MLESVRIRNFRVLRDLEIPELARINLVSGLNNSGKTSLVEALQLLTMGGDIVGGASVWRVNEGQHARGATVHEDWKLMFRDLDTNSEIEVVANHSSRGRLLLKIWIAQPRKMEFPLNGDDVSSPTDQWANDVLTASFSEDGHEVNSATTIKGNSLQLEHPKKNMQIHSAIFRSYRGNFAEDAQALGELRRQKRHTPVEKALRIIDPRLKSVESNPSLGSPIIWADVGLSELVPLPALGEGMTRIARLIMGICLSPGGVVLMDEIENGLHHSVVPDLWRAIDGTAREFDTQVIATTHSFECFAAAHRALGNEGFLFHRLETENEANRCVTYPADAIEGAVEHGLEVR